MNYLLDTHALLWALAQPSKLSVKVRRIIEDGENAVFVSAISFWEVALKSSIGKFDLNGLSVSDIRNAAVASDFQFLDLTTEVCATFNLLEAQHHKDPFDRMLIWQSISENYTLLTNDAQIKKYRTEGLITMW